MEPQVSVSDRTAANSERERCGHIERRGGGFDFASANVDAMDRNDSFR